MYFTYVDILLVKILEIEQPMFNILVMSAFVIVVMMYSFLECSCLFTSLTFVEQIGRRT